MIDIVVPFYNDSDEYWRGIFRDYLSKQNTNDRQVIGDERYRDWDCFKYFFRCIENNCKWVNKVFLLVACESQIPKWLDTNNPKLRIVYHKEFIPEELLPTFNTFTIETYICKIKDLSDNYVYCNDDYYFLNPISKHMFFVDDYPVYRDNGEKILKFGLDYLNASDGTFYSVLNNVIDLQLEVSGDKAKWYPLDHLPVAHKKDFENEIVDRYYNKFLEANKGCFRDKYKYSNHVFTSLYRDLKRYYKFDNYYNSCYVTLKSDVNFEKFKDCDMICFNDTEQLDDFETTKNKMINFFESKFKDKSSYEKE